MRLRVRRRWSWYVRRYAFRRVIYRGMHGSYCYICVRKALGCLGDIKVLFRKVPQGKQGQSHAGFAACILAELLPTRSADEEIDTTKSCCTMGLSNHR